MEFDYNNIRRVVGEEDRLSRLPDELIHMILSCLDMKFAVKTCLLSSRWKLLWTSMPRLNFSSRQFRNIRIFAKFVTNVLSHRNRQIEVSSIKLDFQGAFNQAFVRQIAKYAFSHNVQELTVLRSTSRYGVRPNHVDPPCLFSSQSLKHFKLTYDSMTPCTITSETPWNFPALTTLHLEDIILCDNLFTNCVNLKNLTLEHFTFTGLEVFDIVTPQLSNLILIRGSCCKVINLIAPQLENLTIYYCSTMYLNAPPGISSLCFNGHHPIQLSTDRLRSLNKVSICLSRYSPYGASDEEAARKTINMFQELRSAKYLTLNADVVERLSSFPDLLSQHSSPFGNLKCLTIDYTNTKMKDAYKVTMSGEVRNFLLENSPGATSIMNLPRQVTPGRWFQVEDDGWVLEAYMLAFV